MQLEFVRYEKRNRIAWVTINRPDVMNALHPARERGAVARVGRLRGRPRNVGRDPHRRRRPAFSAGNDLKWTSQHGLPRMPKSGFAG
jgi:acetyl-CoA C-acetyltransferase